MRSMRCALIVLVPHPITNLPSSGVLHPTREKSPCCLHSRTHVVYPCSIAWHPPNARTRGGASTSARKYHAPPFTFHPLSASVRAEVEQRPYRKASGAAPPPQT